MNYSQDKFTALINEALEYINKQSNESYKGGGQPLNYVIFTGSCNLQSVADSVTCIKAR
jgi:hypothetical protein